MPIVQITTADADVKSAVKDLLARQMAAVLAQFPRVDLEDEELCNGRLMEAGFSSLIVLNVSPEARYQAWEILEPHLANRDAYRLWLARNAHVPAPASIVVLSA